MQDGTNKPPVEWKHHLKAGAPVPSSRPEIGRASRVLTMGSCFANEIRATLQGDGVEVLPRLDTEVSAEFVWYTPVSILQEVKLAFGVMKRDERDLWDHGSKPERPSRAKRWQDPYRRFVFADTREELIETIARHDRQIREGFEQATAHLFTLGLIEAWRLPTGNWACLEPYPIDYSKASLHVLTFEESANAIRETIRILREHRPDASITFTISPVPLKRTYREGIDVAVANSESKSVLRAALGQVCREHADVHYFPSYEMVTSLGSRAFKGDGRHVKREVVSSVLGSFLHQRHKRVIFFSLKYAAVLLLAVVLWYAMFFASTRTFLAGDAGRSFWVGFVWLFYLLLAWELANLLITRKASVLRAIFK